MRIVPPDGFDYPSIVAELEGGWPDRRKVAEPVLALIGYEVHPHGRLGLACRLAVEGGPWQSLPSFRSADDAETWLCGNIEGLIFDDLGKNDNGDWYVGCFHPDHGNDYGDSKRLGSAMWAAFVQLVAVEVEE